MTDYAGITDGRRIYNTGTGNCIWTFFTDYGALLRRVPALPGTAKAPGYAGSVFKGLMPAF
jgi:hypothetical protein